MIASANAHVSQAQSPTVPENRAAQHSNYIIGFHLITVMTL